MSIINSVKITLSKEIVLKQWPDIVIKCDYLESDEFEGGLEYGPETIRIEPPLNRIIYKFPEGATIKYLGNNEWFLEASASNRVAIKAALRRIVPVNSGVS